MSAHSDQFAQRRAALQVQCALQREQFARHAAELGSGLQAVNRGIAMVRSTRILPMVLAAVSAAGVLSRAGGVMRLLSRTWVVVSALRQLRRGRK